MHLPHAPGIGNLKHAPFADPGDAVTRADFDPHLQSLCNKAPGISGAGQHPVKFAHAERWMRAAAGVAACLGFTIQHANAADPRRAQGDGRAQPRGTCPHHDDVTFFGRLRRITGHCGTMPLSIGSCSRPRSSAASLPVQ